jgi:hypothetical protein
MTPVRIGGMFSSSSCEDLWASRVEKLQSLREQHPDGPVWLWNIRIRILSFLISRYSHSAPDTTQEKSHDEGREILRHDPIGCDEHSEWTLPIVFNARGSNVGIERAPRDAACFSSVLGNITDENDSIRLLTWRRPPVEAVWNWWRDTYAAKQR